MKHLSKMIRGITLLILLSICTGCAFMIGPQLDETQHVVCRGDTLDKISTIYYGTANNVDLLIQANPELNPQDPKKPLEPGLCVSVPVEVRELMN